MQSDAVSPDAVQPDAVQFELAGGITLRGVEWSSPATHAGVPLVLVHGLASNARLWDGPAREFARLGHPVLALDLRGHGRSDRPDTGYDTATVAADIAHVLVALGTAGWHRPLVLGQSWGGNLVIELAHRHADLVRGVVGVDGGTIELGTAFPDWSECERLLAPPQLIGIAAASLRERMRSFHPDWSEEALDGAMANMEVLADGTVRPWLTRDRHMAILRGLWEHRPSELWSSIEVPVMLVSALGEHLDAASLAKQAAVDHAVASLRRSRAVWFRPADHDLHAQKPVEFAQTVARALDEGFFA